MQPLVYIIIVNYKNYSDTIECIESLERIDYKNYRIIIIDNNSSNNSEEILKCKFPKHIILKTKNNLGFAYGNNVGIKIAIHNNADYILLLNNDTVVEEDFLSKMVLCAENNKNVGIVGGKIYNYFMPETIDYAGGYFDYSKFISIHYRDCDSFDKDVSFIIGCLMLIKADVFEKVGLLSEEFFMYYEDTDFCIRVSENGFRLIYTPEAIIYHKISGSTGGNQSPFSIKWNNRNRLIMIYKYRYKIKNFKFCRVLCYYYFTRLARIVYYSIKGDIIRANSIREGIKEGRKQFLNLKKHGEKYV